MSDVNPYQSPSGEDKPWPEASQTDQVLEEAVEILAQTKTWVRFIAGLGFFITGIMLVFLVASAFMGLAAGAPGPIELIILVPMMILCYFIPSLLLWNYGSRIDDFQNSRHSVSLIAALASQRTFWRYLGALIALGLILYLGLIFLGLFAVSILSVG